MDLLSQALKCLRFTGFVHSRNEFTAPWAFRVPPGGEPAPWDLVNGNGPPRKMLAVFYAIVTGQCWIEIEGCDSRVDLHAGDLVWLVGDRGHQLRDSPGTPARNIPEVLPGSLRANHGGVRYGGDAAVTRLICGACALDDPDNQSLLQNLPPLIRVGRTQADGAGWLRCIIEAMEAETACHGPGSQCILDHLAQALFAHAIRTHARRISASQTNWIRAVSDPMIGPALAKMTGQLDRPWTVATLAESVLMSRSAFAARFRALVGSTPLEYLTHERMRHARKLLAETRTPIKQIAGRAGYTSEAAFNTAFRRLHGLSPGAYRRQNRI